MPVSQFMAASSCLLQLDQAAEEVLGVQEKHRLAMGADLRLPIAQHPRALGLQPIAGGQDVLDLVTDMVDAAGGITVEEGRDRRIAAERLQELDLGIGQGDEDNG